MPTVLRSTAPVAGDALLPGDPARALALAQELLAEPLMSNHAHGLWGYSGSTADGRPLTIQSTGVGAPSAALVLRDLAELGVKRAVRVGTCVGLGDQLGLGETLLCERAIATDGTSRALGANGSTAPDPGLAGELRAAGGDELRAGDVVSTDLITGPGPGEAIAAARVREWVEAGAVAAEMQAAALFALGPRLDLRVACVLVVADLAADPGREVDEAKLDAAAVGAARIAARALSG